MSGINFLEMSDEDLLRHAAPVVTEAPAAVVQQPEPEAAAVEEEVQVETEQEEVETPAVEATADEQEEQHEAEQPEAASVLAAPDAELGDAPKPATQAKPAPAKAAPAADAKAEPTAEEVAAAKTQAAVAFHEEALKPFKAGGREIQVNTVEELRTLAQQGVGYNKKMEALKPHLAIVKQLEQNGLLSDEKIGFLIDLSKKNPEAIGKLLKDSGIDPLDLDSDKVDGYKPNTYAVSDAQMALDTVLDDLKDDEHFKPVLHAVANEWDVASQKSIAAEPQVLRVLAKHKEIGVYDTITNEVERRKALGQLNGVPALQAYKVVGDEFEAAGKFAHLAPKPAAPAVLPTKKTVAAKPAKPAESQAVIDRRKAAASTASAPAKPAPAGEVNFLNLTDEDFAKMKAPI